MKNLDQESILCVLEELNNGLFILDRNHTVIYWNRYMAHHSQKSSEDTVGKNLFDIFQNLPEAWLKKKINSAFILNTTLFTSWEQRPWIFPFPNTRLIDCNIDYMYQNCVFAPIRKGKECSVEFLSVSLYDATELALKHSQVQQTLKELTESSTTDGLTQIYNRRYIQDALEREFSNFQRHGHPVSLLMMDIDYFKRINDNCSHLAGDEVLKNIAQTIKDLIRKCDVVGRYGGEEFVVILPMTEAEGGHLAAERIRSRVENLSTHFEGQNIQATLSIGISTLQQNHANVGQWLHDADERLYESKRSGRNRITSNQNQKHHNKQITQ